MKYHIAGAKMGSNSVTLIHVEPGDDVLDFFQRLLKRAFVVAKPIGGPAMYSRWKLQAPMTDDEARSLIGTIGQGTFVAYHIHVPQFRLRRLGIDLLEQKCSCGSEEPVLVLNETLFSSMHGQSSEELLQHLGARPWANRIRDQELIDRQRGKGHLN